MRFLKILLLLNILAVFLVGCNSEISINQSTGNPSPNDYLKYENADIFLLGDYVYSNAQDLDWVSELEYELGEELGEITSQADRASNFKNGTANKLPIGTKIFNTNTPAYIAVVDGKKILYLKMVEG
ncbi:hypothetical protein [Rossellomorea aquimaris]|uniref:hypothetical protein n=1 Tax=Rossellomorea aquimaris TaxID=189382 RepID=UPI0007D0555D|nr:hypothetical protein [Rossellomorea aquimaris]